MREETDGLIRFSIILGALLGGLLGFFLGLSIRILG